MPKTATVIAVLLFSLPGCHDVPLPTLSDKHTPDAGIADLAERWLAPEASADGHIAPDGAHVVAPDIGPRDPCDVPGTSRSCTTEYQGICAKGSQRCESGGWQPCVPDKRPFEIPEDCDNSVDDDCDGQTDKGDEDCRACTPNQKRDCSTAHLGVCSVGTQRCLPDGSAWEACQVLIVPGSRPERCGDHADDDCDGKTPDRDPDCTCIDGRKSGNETDIDCGGSCPGACGNGAGCRGPSDCSSSYCVNNRCVDRCHNAKKDGNETDTDCGGGCGACALGKQCASHSDCTSGFCVGNRCVVDPCTNGVKDGDETGIDCGGSCAACPHGAGCKTTADCGAELSCSNSTCLSCTTHTPTLSDTGCGPLETQAGRIWRDGNRIAMICFDTTSDNNETTRYIAVAGATLGGTGCLYNEGQSGRLWVDGNRIAMNCIDSMGETDTVRYITVTNARLSGGCPHGHYKEGTIRRSGNSIVLHCVDPTTDRGSDGTISFAAETVCR